MIAVLTCFEQRCPGAKFVATNSTTMEAFQELKPYLFTVAYNILGEIYEAEDIVQDAFEHFLGLEEEKVRNRKAYLTRVVANKAIDRLAVLKKQREAYPGTWLPEPVVDADPVSATDAGIMSYEAMVALEQLNPVERGVLVLREAFDYSYGDLAALFQLSEENARQVLHRAKKKARLGDHKRDEIDRSVATELIGSFLQACTNGDTRQLEDMLKASVAMMADGGGKASAAVKTLFGPQVVAKFLLGIFRKGDYHDVEIRQVYINGKLAFCVLQQGSAIALSYLKLSGGKVENIYVIRNPDKIHLPNLSQN